MTQRTCTFQDCTRPHYGRGLCAGHHAQRVRGAPLKPLRPPNGSQPIMDRIWANIDRETSDCWRWTGNVGKNGYGRISVQNRRRLAHRAVWELLRGPIPKGMVLDHDNPDFGCGNPLCVKPDHLEVVTHKINLQRARGLRSTNTSGYRGVTWSKKFNCWVAQVMADGRTHFGGHFSDAEQAAQAAEALRRQLH